ncbi:MAG TPA: glycoside hydrolase family 30 beta sandwich domain-containing protein [Clostridia bacterium]|nr:glycoside hydrolase family 30 beta sandwich domain-containing protein [Clostridia bacterium]
MYKKIKGIAVIMALILLIGSSAAFGTVDNDDYPYSFSANVNFNANKEFQTIQGFGGFGFRDVNWSDPSGWWTDSWGDTVLNDLGFSITRNEWYPPQIEGETQDSNWEVQNPFIQKYHNLAKLSGKPLKQILAIWSPPAHMKSNNSTKNGGTLLPEFYDDFGRWLVECLDAYKEAGVDVYGISPQNEPSAVVEYNSCHYTPQEYVNMIKVVGPIVKASYPKVKLLGPEEMTCETWTWNKSYGKALLDDKEALKWIDVIVVHAYTIEYQVVPSDTRLEAMQMKQVYEKYKKAGKEIWQTEVCSWYDHFQYKVTIAESIFNSLYYGNASAWLAWVVSSDGSIPGNYLMKHEEKGPLYYGVRQFSQYVLPGAKRIYSSSSNDELLAIAFKHPENKTFTMVLINKAFVPMNVKLDGNIKTEMNMVMTTDTEDAVNAGTIKSSGSKTTLPPRSIVTLQGTYK